MKNICLIVIGCNYEGTERQLNGCINDALDIAETITTKAEQFNYSLTLKLLTDNQLNKPTKKNIINLLETSIKECNNNKYSNLIFYFAGHGVQHTDTNFDESDSLDESILTTDMKFIYDDEFRNILNKLNNRKTDLSFIFDCCHSGTILDLPKIVIGKNNNYSERELNKKKILCICACDDNQLSIEENGRGLFTKLFCKIIRKSNNNQAIFPLLQSIQYELNSSRSNMTITFSSTKRVKTKQANIFNIKSF